MTRFPSLRLLAIPLATFTLASCALIGPLIQTALPFAGIKLLFACLPEGTCIDTPGGPRTVEQLQPGDTVTGYSGAPVLILQKHAYLESQNTEFFRVSFTDGATVDLCGRHRLAGQPAGHLRVGQTLANRRIECIEIHQGVVRSFDLLTEDSGYRIQGLPVNSMIEEMHAAAAGLRLQKL